MNNETIEPALKAMEELLGCRLCLHLYNDLFYRGPVPLIDRTRQSHRKTFPDQCGREQRSYCLRHCMDELNRRMFSAPERDLFAVHCRNGYFELVAPVFRDGKCVLALFAGLLDPGEKEKIRRIAGLLPVFAAGLEARARTMTLRRKGKQNGFIERVEDFIEKHYPEPVSTADAAKALCVSISRFCHILRESGQTSFSGMLMNERLYHAKQMLSFGDPDFPIAEIARLCGFPSYEHFSRSFHRETGESPASWRKKHAG